MNTKKREGFTLAELLIVMAIIVVLAAVAIPTFGRQLETSRETGDMELIRSAYTEALSYAALDAADGMMDGKNGNTKLGGVDAIAALPSTKAGLTATVLSFPATGDDAGVKCTYIVTLEKMDAEAKIKQTGSGWQYVNNEILGQAVGTVITKQGTAAYTQAVCFMFEMDDADGNVRLTEYASGDEIHVINVADA